MRTMLAVLWCVSFVFAQKTTVNLDVYKNSKKYTYAEKNYTLGKHQYTFVNVKPAAGGDTTCISAIVIDKRKLVFHDIGYADRPSGLLIPAAQPLGDALIVLKISPLEGKTFLIPASGKIVSLPGSSVLIDAPGTTLYCVWENDGQYRLTVFDFGRNRLLITAQLIAKPAQWSTDGTNYAFTVAGEKGHYVVDGFLKTITKNEKPDAEFSPATYLIDTEKVNAQSCCSITVLKK